jgi:hypothetical protein
MFEGIKNIRAEVTSAPAPSKKTMHFFECVLACLAIFLCWNISLLDAVGVSDFVKRVTSSWTPKQEDIGKIKFVSFSFENGTENDGVFIVSRPFKNYYATNVDSTTLEVNGLGDFVIISPIDGVVQDVSFSAGKCAISIKNQNVIVQLLQVDYACVSVGESVQVGQKIAVSTSSILQFKLLCDGQYITLSADNCGDTFFS